MTQSFLYLGGVLLTNLHILHSCNCNYPFICHNNTALIIFTTVNQRKVAQNSLHLNMHEAVCVQIEKKVQPCRGYDIIGKLLRYRSNMMLIKVKTLFWVMKLFQTTSSGSKSSVLLSTKARKHLIRHFLAQ